MGSDVPDSLNTELVAPEFKYMIRLLVREGDFQQAKRNAAKVGKLPLLAIKERGNTRKRAVMDWDDFVKLYWLAVWGEQNAPDWWKETHCAKATTSNTAEVVSAEL